MLKFTLNPLGPGKPSSQSVPVLADPPATLPGLKVTDARLAGRRVSVSVIPTVSAEALTVKFACASTPIVPIVKLVNDWPAGTVTVFPPGNRIVLASLVTSVTSTPPAGAGAERVMTPVELLPPTKELGTRANF